MEIGETIGGYEIVTRLQSGGMADLFLARRVGAAGFSRPVVIKTIKNSLSSDDEFVRMFVDEAKICARIDHPNVVHVEELGVTDGVFYLVMEHILGVSLSELARALKFRQRALTPELATAIAIRIADGLHGAHETRDDSGQLLGIVHRDVSPHNVLISYRGHVKIIDFGVAKARGRSIQTTGGSLKGKLRYMSPEQAYGRPIDRRTDVYALGIVLWELLTQHTLFRADNELALLELVRDPDVRPPSTHNPQVPPALDLAIMRALSRSADARPASAHEFRDLLAAAIPSAAGLSANHIAELLQATCGDILTSRTEAVQRRVAKLDPVAADAEPQTMSRSEASKVLAELTIDVDASQPSEVRAPPGRPSDHTPRPISASVSLSGRDVPRSRGRLWLALAGVTILVASGAVVWTSSGGSPEPTATSPGVEAASPAPVATSPTSAPAEEAAPAPPLVPDAGHVAVAEAAPAPEEVEPEPVAARTGRSRRGGSRAMAPAATADEASPPVMGMLAIPLAGADEF